MGFIVYYVFIYPLSLLPFRVIYIIADVFYGLLVIFKPYRKKVIRENIQRSFPEKTERERRQIEHQFYRFFADLLAEGIKNLSISKKQLLKRVTVENPEVLTDLYEKNKSVLLVSGHCNNWEWLIKAQHLLFPHQAVGIGMPMTSGFWNKKVNEKRSNFGMKVIHSKIVNDFFNTNNTLTATLVLADQSPGNSYKCYWTQFLNQTTGFVFGPEIIANKFDQAVVYFQMIKVRRGYYTYDEKGKKIATLASSTGDFKNAAGNSFNLKKGSWIYTFDKNCKKTGTRAA